MNIKKILFASTFLVLLGATWPFSWIFSNPNGEPFGTSEWLNKEIRIIKSQTNNIDPKVLRLSLIAYINAKRKGYNTRDVLTVIDYSKPSTERRLWVFDLKHGRTLFNTWVAHGKNSGGLLARSFSNTNGSLKSSLGVFVTDYDPYIGGNGYSLRLKGLESGINDNAYDRNVVIHGAWYVNPDTIRRYGQIGRSWGCPAVSANTARSLIDTIKDKSVVVAYYPDRNWLNHSRFLNA